MTGHVFVLQGDVMHLACDAWLLPTDKWLKPHRWPVPGLEAAIAALGSAADDVRNEKSNAVALEHWDLELPLPVLTAVSPYGFAGAQDAALRAEQGLHAAASAALERRLLRPRTSEPQEHGPAFRERPLIALPLFGTRGGGGDAVRGDLIDALLDAAERVAGDADVDVVLVLRRVADAAHAQRTRRERTSWPMLGALVGDAQDLAERVRNGSLVPFLGAGVSVSAGLPLWPQLVERLARRVAVPADEYDGFLRLGVLDQASVLHALFKVEQVDFLAAVADETRAERYGLAPALLAGLPTREAVTLNYDTLYELAAKDAGHDVDVVSDVPMDESARWLLKLHGTIETPQSIVLTRDHYLSYGSQRGALSALAKALLLTRHLLFVGFGFADDHFHEVMHDVRSVMPGDGTPRTFGTALVLGPDRLYRRLWGNDVRPLALQAATRQEQARLLEIFLDCLLAHATVGLSYFLDRRFLPQLAPEEVDLRRKVLDFHGALSARERATPAGRAVTDFLRSLGARDGSHEVLDS